MTTPPRLPSTANIGMITSAQIQPSRNRRKRSYDEQRRRGERREDIVVIPAAPVLAFR